MKILDLLNKNLVISELLSTNKDSIISELANILLKDNKITDLEGFVADVKERESQTTTAIGGGLAIPHAKSKFVTSTSIVFARSTSGVNYDALDGKPVHLFFMLAVKQGEEQAHVDILAKLSKLFLDEVFYKKLMEAKTTDDVLAVISSYDTNDNEVFQNKDFHANHSKYFVVAVTACPTGIAHTYMAAESLEKAAKELKIDIKVETNGASGIKNALTKEDIDRSTGVILAINRTVETNRFKGKKLIQVSAAEAIKDAKELIMSTIRGKCEIFQGSGDDDSEFSVSASSSGSIGKDLYKHLMGGVTYMLPFVISGGILIALAFLIDTLAGVQAGPNLGSTTQLANLFKTVGGQAFALFVPVLGAFIAYSISGRAALTAGFVGASLAASSGAGFLGAILAGFLAGYVTVFIMFSLKGTPKSLDGLKSILILPVLSVLVTGVFMVILFNSPVKAINDGLFHWLNTMGGTNKILLGLILGGMMSIDMGGPINKAAYVFGTVSLANASGSSEIMAAVMAGGMTPPLGIAFATTFFKNRFTAEQREAGKSNYIMGLSFITEGAIPFAASNPLRIIPTLTAGSAVAGALSSFFSISLPAPHGGIVVMFLSNHVWLYMLSVLIGSLVTAVLLGIVKKPIDVK